MISFVQTDKGNHMVSFVFGSFNLHTHMIGKYYDMFQYFKAFSRPRLTSCQRISRYPSVERSEKIFQRLCADSPFVHTELTGKIHNEMAILFFGRKPLHCPIDLHHEMMALFTASLYNTAAKGFWKGDVKNTIHARGTKISYVQDLDDYWILRWQGVWEFF